MVSGAAGTILQNSNGETIAGCYCPLENVPSAATAKSMTLLKGLEPLGCRNVMIESDSLELIQTCNGTTEIWSAYSASLA
jgi:hypothetical protein